MANTTARPSLPVLAIVVAMSAPSFAQPPAAVQTGMPVEALKRLYLDCERGVAAGEMRGGGVALCSIAYEELKRRAFGGDFGRLKAWYDAAIGAGSGA